MDAAAAAMKSDPARNYQFLRFRPPDPQNGERRPAANGTALQISTRAQPNIAIITALVRHAQRLQRCAA